VGGRIGKVKMRQFVGCDKGNLIGKAKAVQAQIKQNKEFIHYFPSSGRCSAINRKAGLCHAPRLLGKVNAVTLNIPPSSFFQLLPMSMTPDTMCWV